MFCSLFVSLVYAKYSQASIEPVFYFVVLPSLIGFVKLPHASFHIIYVISAFKRNLTK